MTTPKQLTEEASIKLQELTADTDMTDAQFIKLLEFVATHSQLAVEEVLKQVDPYVDLFKRFEFEAFKARLERNNIKGEV